MEKRDIILNELRELSPVIASMSKQLPYVVPAGYFEELPVQVFLRIAMEEKKGTDPVLNIKKENTYEVPAGYFDGLAATILNRIKASETENAQEELELISPLLGKIEKKHPFSSPVGYFDDLSKNIVDGVQAINFVNEELENLSPLMASLKEKNVYEVPQEYFANLPAEVLKKINQQPAKIVSIGFGRKVMRYAAAAAIAGVITFGAYKFINPAISASAETSIAKVSDKDLESFLDGDAVIDVADTSAVNTTAAADLNDNDTKDLLADISDDELQQYLDQHGGSSNAVTN